MSRTYPTTTKLSKCSRRSNPVATRNGQLFVSRMNPPVLILLVRKAVLVHHPRMCLPLAKYLTICRLWIIYGGSCDYKSHRDLSHPSKQIRHTEIVKSKSSTNVTVVTLNTHSLLFSLLMNPEGFEFY